MDVYLASPNSQIQADYCNGMNVLLSFACFSDWLFKYQQTFRRILIDCGAWSVFNTGKKIDLFEYKDWSAQWVGHAEAIAGLDDIGGDYKRGLKNLSQIEWTFPTWHDTDPLEILPELVAIAQERKTWLGIGLMPPRHGKERIIREALERIPESIHVHGWALRGYTHIRRFDSFDSSNWFRDAMKIRTLADTKHLSYGEALDIVIKRYQRETRVIKEETQEGLFTNV